MLNIKKYREEYDIKNIIIYNILYTSNKKMNYYVID